MKQFSKKMYALSLCMILSAPTHSAKLLTGDPLATAGNTFSFNVGTYAFDSINGYFYTGTADPFFLGDAQKPYAISVTQLSSGIVAPNAPTQAYVNGSLTANPFYNKIPAVLGLSGTQLLAVATESITDLYAFTSAPGSSTVTMLKSDVMRDAEGLASTGVVESANQQTVVGTGSTIFAAVSPNNNPFGRTNLNGGIAIYAPAADGSGLVQQGNAKKIDRTVAKLAIAGPIQSLAANAVDMYCDSYLQRLYVAVQPTGALGAGNGARAILVGRLQNNNGTQELEFSAIAPEACFPDANRIVGGKSVVGQAIVSTIYKVRTMHTSTGLSYLIVNGNTVEGPLPGEEKQRVFALPLVDENSSASSTAWTSSATHGTLASVKSAPTVNWTLGQFGSASSEFFYSRTYATPATQADHLYDSAGFEEFSAMVGGGPTNIDVIDMFVHRDTVFISAAQSNANCAAGIYYSQALFNANGSIKGWTVWQRAFVDGVDENDSGVSGMAYSPTKGNFTFVGKKGDGNFNKIRSTQWSDGALDGLLGGTTADSSVGLVAQLKNEFPESNGGIQGFFTFPKITQGFRIELEVGVATGYKKVIIAQLGKTINNNVIFPEVGDFATNKLTQTDGTWGNTTGGNTIMVSVTGGALDTLGAITSATIVSRNGNDGYLIVAGVGGVAALRDTALGQEGNGWGGLQKNFVNMPTTMQFDIIGNFSNVIKLWCAGETLYVLTPTSLTRIESDDLNNDPASAITGRTIATPAGMGLPSSTTFSDFVASNFLGVLATSEGLYRTSNGLKVSEVVTNVFGDWTNVLLPGGYTPVTRLIPVSATEFPYEFAGFGTQNGNLYVLNASVSEQAAAVYRFSVGDATVEVNNGALQLIQDQLLKDTTGPLAYLGTYRNHFYSDGALLTTSRSKNNTENPLFQSFPLSYATQQKIFSKGSVTPIDLGIGAASALNNVVRNPSQGGWLMSGSFGLVVNE